jgi:amidase
MDEHEYLSFDGLGLSELVATKQVTAAELLAIAQARADRVNPRINAVVNRLDEYAEAQLGQELTGP